MREKNRGFSLIELLIVVAIILIIAAIAIPNLLRARGSADEAAAVEALRTINTAEITYASTYPDIGFTCSLSSLGPASGVPTPTSAGLIDSVLASGSKSGYTFTLSGCTGTPGGSYFANADPLPNQGVRKFCTDQSGVIRYDPGTGSCTASSAPLP
jgi:prepilin-type N-terminal cleavage/methylation domain-containing protein